MSITAQEYKEGRDAFHAERIRRGRRCGPCYGGNGICITPFHDQYFGKDFEPVGTVNCPRALRVGSVNQALEVMVLAAPTNEGSIVIPAGSTVTISFMQGMEEEGVFEDVGPTICVKAPAEGMLVDPCHHMARFPLPNFSKPWVMISLEFSGAITGGKCDAILNHVAR